MNEHFESLRCQMEEAAALPADDPQRQAVVRQLLAGPEAEQIWLDLLHEDEQWRLALRHVELPEGLERRLRSIPDEVPATGGSAWTVSGWWGGAIAAAAVLAVGVGLILSGGTEVNAAEMFAASAVQKHLDEPRLTVESADPGEIASSFRGHLPQEVRMPETMIDPTYRLVGGMKSRIDDKPVVYTRWERDGQVCAVYQFCKQDFPMGGDLAAPQKIRTPRPGRSDYEVTLWTEDHCAYALVAEQGARKLPQPPM